MIADAARVLERLCAELLSAEASANLATMRGEVESRGFAWLETRLASLPRRIGREFVEPLDCEALTGAVTLAAFRACDLAAADLLGRLAGDAGATPLIDLYEHGDAFERRMILKSIVFLDRPEESRRLLVEAHRTNDEELFRAAFADTAAPARLLPDEDFARGVLKCAFLDVALDRILEAETRACETLSAMLLEFMSEREAAGRPTWPGSLELAAHAPCRGVVARVLGDLHHGDDGRRRHAVRAAGILLGTRGVDIESELESRRGVERSAAIRAEIDAILG